MAVSVWVEAVRHAPGLPREHRIPFCNGIGLTLLSLGVIFTAAGYYMQALLPALFGAAAMFITPISFLVSTARNARLLLEKAALALGLALAPILAFSHADCDAANRTQGVRFASQHDQLAGVLVGDQEMGTGGDEVR